MMFFQVTKKLFRLPWHYLSFIYWLPDKFSCPGMIMECGWWVWLSPKSARGMPLISNGWATPLSFLSRFFKKAKPLQSGENYW